MNCFFWKSHKIVFFKNEIFLKNRSPLRGSLTPCGKPEKSNELIPRKLSDGRRTKAECLTYIPESIRLFPKAGVKYGAKT